MPREYRARIPDEDAGGWIMKLYECGFTTEEVDRIMTHLNDTFAEQKFQKIHGNLADKLMKEFEDEFLSKNVQITPELHQQIREYVIEKIRRESQA